MKRSVKKAAKRIRKRVETREDPKKDLDFDTRSFLVGLRGTYIAQKKAISLIDTIFIYTEKENNNFEEFYCR